jgi:hypothetical protein
MKDFLSIPIINELKRLGGKSNFQTPTMEKVPDGYILNWDYQTTSWACQGSWSSFSRFVDSSKDYYKELHKFENDLTDFVKKEFTYYFKKQ